MALRWPGSDDPTPGPVWEADRVLPPLETVSRHRPVHVVQPSAARSLPAGRHPVGAPAPYVAATLPLTGAEGRLELTGPGLVARAVHDGDAARLDLEVDGTRHTLRSRRHARCRAAEELALALTGRHLSVLTRDGAGWTVRARVDLAEHGVDPHAVGWSGQLEASCSTEFVAGRFGQLGLRDVRLVSSADGTPVRDGDHVLLTATHAGPGFFDTGQTGVWGYDPARDHLVHRGTLWFRRAGDPRVFGDHATHLVHDDDAWLVATSTWSDFDLDAPEVHCTLGRSGADLTRGEHVVDTAPLDLPDAGYRRVGTWDPHLVRVDEEWLVGYVAATRFFRFHPALAAGPDLAHLTHRGAAADRRATEGTTLLHLDGRWLVGASDGPDGRRGQRRGYPLFDLTMQQVGALDAPHPSNIPWPTLLEQDGRTWLVTFDGTPTGGPVAGYGTHGDLVVAASADPGATS